MRRSYRKKYSVEAISSWLELDARARKEKAKSQKTPSSSEVPVVIDTGGLVNTKVTFRIPKIKEKQLKKHKPSKSRRILWLKKRGFKKVYLVKRETMRLGSKAVYKSVSLPTRGVGKLVRRLWLGILKSVKKRAFKKKWNEQTTTAS